MEKKCGDAHIFKFVPNCGGLSNLSSRTLNSYWFCQYVYVGFSRIFVIHEFMDSGSSSLVYILEHQILKNKNDEFWFSDLFKKWQTIRNVYICVGSSLYLSFFRTWLFLPFRIAMVHRNMFQRGEVHNKPTGFWGMIKSVTTSSSGSESILCFLAFGGHTQALQWMIFLNLNGEKNVRRSYYQLQTQACEALALWLDLLWLLSAWSTFTPLIRVGGDVRQEFEYGLNCVVLLY